MNKEEIVELLKCIRIRIADVGEYRFDNKRAEEIAHKMYIEAEDKLEEEEK